MEVESTAMWGQRDPERGSYPGKWKEHGRLMRNGKDEVTGLMIKKPSY